ncbi:MAG: class I SAM-dependent methyltransferase [Gammaproteobacteria bacterium]|nr:class I SAM-dependent methyltransferase [Gammaproteobacteria bacterium]
MWYHQFVYDADSRKLIGKFEELYRDGAEKGLDAWHQDALELREDVVIAKSVLGSMTSGRPVRTVVDLGCGKGVLAQHLFRDADRYVGIDISETAVETAQRNFPGMEFIHADVQTGEDLAELVSSKSANNFDLFFSSQTLSYMQDWRGIIEQATENFRSLLIVLYLPPDPIGYIKSFGGLVDEVWRNFEGIRCSFSPSGSHIAISGQSARMRSTSAMAS